MAYDIQKVLNIALAEVGYLEKETEADLDSKTGNAGDNNYTKYARDLAEVNFFNGKKQGVAWCATFVAWDFYKAYGKSAALKLLCQPARDNCGAGCKYARDYYKAKGQLHTSNPQPGDQIFFYSKDKTQISHTGLVYKVDKSRVYTVEGNTSGSSGVVANGGGVFKKSYALTYDRLAGYGRPEYGQQTAAEPETKQEPETEAKKENTTPAASGLTFQVGDVVQFNGNRHYTNPGAASGPACKPGRAKVTKVSPTGKHPYHLRAVSGGGSTVYGWVNAADVAAPGAIAVGDLVQFAGGPHYTNANAKTSKASPKAGPAKVTKINKAAKHPYHIIHTDGKSSVYGWVDADTVEKLT